MLKRKWSDGVEEVQEGEFFCPMCQAPLDEVEQQKREMHVSDCLGNAQPITECLAGARCSSRGLAHYRLFKHTELTKSRSFSSTSTMPAATQREHDCLRQASGLAATTSGRSATSCIYEHAQGSIGSDQVCRVNDFVQPTQLPAVIDLVAESEATTETYLPAVVVPASEEADDVDACSEAEGDDEQEAVHAAETGFEQTGTSMQPALKQRTLGAYFSIGLAAQKSVQKVQQLIGPYFGMKATPPAKQLKRQPTQVQPSAGIADTTGDTKGNDRSCPFYKRMPGTYFTVDAFRFGAVPQCRGYFLSHFHTDHYGGLTSKWVHGPIYCSQVTANLVLSKLRVSPEYVVALPMHCMQVVDGVEVTLLEANHCPGAALFLFKNWRGQHLLHTGDFRADCFMQQFKELQDTKVDELYLDTTYCNPRYCFPPQQLVIGRVVDIVQKALAKNRHTLIVVGAYSIGKEKVYMAVAEALNACIYADSQRIKTLGCLEWPALQQRLTADACVTNVHVLPIFALRPEGLNRYLRKFGDRWNAVLAFRPTGWTYSEKLGKELELLKPTKAGAVTVYGVPYSEHSSYLELQEFVQFVRPKRIIPTVNVGTQTSRDKMQACFDKWLPRSR
eukprot:jgi/Chlat1/3866/Chrsp26S04160